MIDFEPEEEQQLIAETVHQFAENEIRPLARPADEAAEIPGAVLDAAHELGVVGNALPEAHGGGGERSAVTGVLVAEALGWGDLAMALAILSPGLIGLPVMDHGSDAQQSDWIPPLTAARYCPGSLALVEPSFGADPFRPSTTAKREGSEFVLTGRKCQVPWQQGVPFVLVAADAGERAELFAVPSDAPGLEAAREEQLGIRAFPTASLTLDGVRVPAEALLGDGGGSDLRQLVTRGRTALSALGIGVAQAAFEVARDYAKEREAFGVKIAQKQAIAFKLADMAIEIDGARLLTWEAAWRLDQGLPALREATLAYQQVRRVALDVADGAVQVFGGHGYIRDYLPEMHLRNARGFASFEALALV